MILISLLNIATFQGIVLAIVILKSPLFKSNANKYLAYAIFTLSFSLLNLALDDTGVYNTVPLLIFIDIIDSGILFPVFIFLYVIHQVDHPIKNSNKKIWLFIPYLYSLICNILDENTIANLFQIPFIFKFLIDFINLIITLFFIPCILIYTYILIKFSKNIKEKKWLTHLWLLTFTLFASFVLTIILALFLDFDITPTMKILALLATFLIHWIVYTGIFKFKLARDQEEIKTLLNKLKPNNNNPVVTELAPLNVLNEQKTETFTKENIHFKKLRDLCLNQQIYKDSTLDRDKVAKMLGISTGYVSQLINTITGNNFTTYINHYRVEAVKDIIINPEFDNYSLLAIGLECGFSSKTTFHNAFKKITGITPNAYRKMHK